MQQGGEEGGLAMARRHACKPRPGLDAIMGRGGRESEAER